MYLKQGRSGWFGHVLLHLCFLVPFAWATPVFGQGFSSATPAREFIHLNGQVVAIENNGQGTTGPGGGYQYVRTLTIDGTKLTANLTNFPVLFAETVSSLASSAYGGHVQNPNGYDILFTSDAAGMHKLNWEVESYDGASGAVVDWIQIPSLPHGVTTTIYMFYGNANVATDPSNRTATWDSTFTAVYHFGAAFGGDSTGHANNATASGPVSGAGQIGTGANFAAGGYLSAPDSALIDSGTGTWGFWFRDDGPPIVPGGQKMVKEPANPYFVAGCAAVLTKADTHDSVNGIGFATCNGSLFVQAKNATTATQTPGITTTAGWHQAAFAFTSGGSYSYYEDGALMQSGSLISFSISSANPLRIGLSLDPGWPATYIGSLDEVRLSGAVRSAAWVATEYYNQSEPTTFVTVGNEAAR